MKRRDPPSQTPTRDGDHGDPRTKSGGFNDEVFLRGLPRDGDSPVVGPVKLQARISKGGMGIVYRGHHLKLDIDVAVKFLLPHLAQNNPEYVLRFEREARVAAQLNNENLVRVFDVDSDRHYHYVVMELVCGETARDRVARKGPLAEAEALEIILGATRGLDAAHKKGIVHRDIKPENIMIDASGVVKLADLGIAKVAKENESAEGSITQPGIIIGTPCFMAPEQVQDAHTVCASSDIYSMGATLYFLLTGKVPFEGNLLQIFKAITTQGFPDIRQVRPGISEPLLRILQGSTHLDPFERIADAKALLREIERCGIARASLSDSGVGTVRAEARVSTPPRQRVGAIKLQVDDEDWRTAKTSERRRSPALASAGLLLLGAVLAAAGYFGVNEWRKRQEASGPPPDGAPAVAHQEAKASPPSVKGAGSPEAEGEKAAAARETAEAKEAALKASAEKRAVAVEKARIALDGLLESARASIASGDAAAAKGSLDRAEARLREEDLAAALPAQAAGIAAGREALGKLEADEAEWRKITAAAAGDGDLAARPESFLAGRVAAIDAFIAAHRDSPGSGRRQEEAKALSTRYRDALDERQRRAAAEMAQQKEAELARQREEEERKKIAAAAAAAAIGAEEAKKEAARNETPPAAAPGKEPETKVAAEKAPPPPNPEAIPVPAWAQEIVSPAQVEGARQAGLPVAREVDLGGGVTLHFLYLPPGAFTMGGGGGVGGGQDPEHPVTLTRGYYLGQHEVTRGAYAAVLGSAPGEDPKNAKDPGRVAVTGVNWEDAERFCRLLPEKLPVAGKALRFRLPSEAEWEYACRAGAKDSYPWGTPVDDRSAWFWVNSGGRPQEVGQKKATPWGFQDLLGNASEWCQDWHGAYPKEAATDPTGPVEGTARVLRGGSWKDFKAALKPALRRSLPPATASGETGFRVVLEP